MPRILVIDDDDEVRELIGRILGRAGYEVSDAANGKIGFDLYRKERPDLVITDIIMPEMEGVETIIAIRGECLDAKIIAISGGSETIRTSICLSVGSVAGALRTLSKPITPQDILEAVHELLDEG
jgi:CheY-like chemotaxis protein